MADIIDGIWGVIRGVIITASLLALATGVICSIASYFAGRGTRESEWTTLWEGRSCDVPHTNGVYTLQFRIKEG